MRADAGFYLFIVIYTFAGLVFLAAVGATEQAAFSVYALRWFLIFGLLLPAVAILSELLWLFRRFEKRRSLAARRMFSTGRLATFLSGLALLMAFGLFQATFTSIKNGLPVWRDGFHHDRLQADIDAWLHFGTDPWRWLQMAAGSDLARTLIEWNYNVLWFVICFGALFFVATSPKAAAIRTRYLICFALVWVVIGNVLAGVFLSAGPAFYGYVTGDAARFSEQLAFLARSAASQNSAAAYQHYLWSRHEAGATGFGSGISAFPSVHVGLITVNALFVLEYSRKLGIAAFAYVLFIVMSSVYLAWHYAIDGYAAVVLTTAMYLAVRRWVPAGRVSPTPAAASLPVGRGAATAS
jgi:hypothetical protein